MKQFVFTALFLLLPALALAGTASVPVVPPPVLLNYNLYAGGLKVVDVGISYAISDSQYDIHANAKTRGMWATLVPWRNMITARGSVEAGHIAPQVARYDTAWREKLKTIEMSWAKDGALSVVSTPPQRPDGRVEATAEQIKNALDPVSAVVAVLARGGQDGCSGRIPAFDGRRLYNLVMENKGEEVLTQTDYNIYHGPAIRCEVTFEPVAGFPEKEQRAGFWSARDNSDKRNPLIIWIAHPQPGLPLFAVRVQSTTNMGTIIAHLRSVASGAIP